MCALKNATFSCSHKKISIDQYRCSLIDSDCYSDSEKLQIMNFYVANALIPACKLNRKLSDYGWIGRKLLGQLERHFIEVCSINPDFFLIARTSRFPKTLSRFNLNIGNKLCVSCPRGAMIEECIVEEGVVEKRGKQNRIEIILTHIRNALAHGNTYVFPNSNILLLDMNRQGDKTCALLIPSKGLLDFMLFIVNGPNNG